MSWEYSINYSLNDEYETKIQSRMRLSDDKHDDEINDNVYVDK